VKNRSNSAYQPLLLEFAGAAALLTLVVYLWFLLSERELQNLRSKVNLEASYLTVQIEADFRSRLPVLQRLSRTNFEAEATTYLNDMPGIPVLGWIDFNGLVRQVVPPKGYQKALGLDPSIENSRRKAFERAEKTLLPAMTEPLNLVEGGRGTLMYLPRNQAGELPGFVLAVFRFDAWLDFVFAARSPGPFTDDFQISVAWGGLPIYENKGFLGLSAQKIEGKSKVRVLDQTWDLSLRPTKAFVSRGKTLLPEVVAFSGALVSLLLVFVVRLFRRASTEVELRNHLESDFLSSAPHVKLLLDSTGEAIYGMSLDGCCTFANPACARLLGYASASELIGQHMHELIHHHNEAGEVIPVEDCRIYQVFTQAEATHADNEVFWKADGTAFPVEYLSYPQLDNGVTIGAVVTFADITARRASEKEHLELEQRLQKLNESLEERVQERTAELSEALEVVQLTRGSLVQQEKMASLGRLAAGIAHEINNPTGYILSNMATLGEYFSYMSELSKAAVNLQHSLNADPQALIEAARLFEEALSKDDLDYILGDATQLLSDSNKGAIRIRDIVQGLRSFAHGENSEPVMSDLNEIVQESLKIVNNKLKYHCTLDVQLGVLRPFMAQSGRLEQVVINLLTNAADAIPTRGTIIVKTWAEPSSVCLSVTDDGQGMPPELVKRVFEPFFTTKDVGKGTGLGLSISMGIIEDHRGTIDLNSAVGRGTTFTVKLPA